VTSSRGPPAVAKSGHTGVKIRKEAPTSLPGNPLKEGEYSRNSKASKLRDRRAEAALRLRGPSVSPKEFPTRERLTERTVPYKGKGLGLQ